MDMDKISNTSTVDTNHVALAVEILSALTMLLNQYRKARHKTKHVGNLKCVGIEVKKE